MSTQSRPQLVLASASPRRRELLEQIGIRFVIQAADIDESPRHHEGPEELVQRLAAAKSKQISSRMSNKIPVLGADTIVVLGDKVLGKPSGREQAIEMLSALSGCEHRVLSAVSLRAGNHGHLISETRVWFRKLKISEIEAYCATSEPLDKAGSYAIQGYGAVFVSRIEGSYSGVVGLPIYETAMLLNQADIRVPGD